LNGTVVITAIILGHPFSVECVYVIIVIADTYEHKRVGISVILLCFDFLTTLSVAHCIVSYDRTTANNELERMWKEAVVDELKVVYRHLPAERNHEKARSG
jgi:hypothetical protein